MTDRLRLRLLFAVLCLVWGATWLALKVGAQGVPPALFAGLRWTVAGLLLVGWRAARGRGLRLPLRLLARIVAVALLMNTTAALMQLYALRHVDSGLAAVISAALTPLSLLGFGLVLGQERFRPTQLAAIALGIAGILLLFGPRISTGDMGAAELAGAVGIIGSCLAYCLGSVLARPLMRVLTPADVAGATNLIGGLLLLVVALLQEPSGGLALDWGIAAWSAWLFLLLAGSLGASIIYFVLVRDWGAGRTGTYAFVSPVISVLLGIAVLGERIAPSEVVGMAVMLSAAGLVLRLRP